MDTGIATITQPTNVRNLILAANDYAYFQTGGHSLKPEPVIDEVIHWLRFQNRGPALPMIAQRMQQIQDEVRTRVARTINADPAEIALTENTTVGINIVANGFDWRPGDNVVLSTHEHPGNRVPWYHIAQRHQVELRFIKVTPDDAQILNQLKDAIDSRTRVVSLSHVSRRTGQRLPAQDIVATAHQRCVPVLFDGAQSLGAIPVDVKALDCDFYTFSGHKYILGPQGTGGFYIKRDRLETLKASWLGSHSQQTMDDEGHMTLRDTAVRFEFGTRDIANQAGFGRALAIWESIGWKNVFAQIEAYTDCLKAALGRLPGILIETPMPYSRSSAIVTFRLPALAAESLCDSLLVNERVLVAPSGTGGVRVCTHVFNTEEERERLLSGLWRIHKHGL